MAACTDRAKEVARIGEASNPGPEALKCPRVLTTANVTSLYSAVSLLPCISSSVIGMQEHGVPIHQQRALAATLRAEGIARSSHPQTRRQLPQQEGGHLD